MSKYYNPRRSRNIYDPASSKPFKISRSKIDLWIDGNGEYIVVDYKATAKKEPVNSLNQTWQAGYKRQMEIYQ